MTDAAELLRARYGMDTGPGAPDEVSPAVAGLLARRCIRRYTEAPIPDALLDTLLACAQSAPTKSNLQQYSIVVTTDPVQLGRLAELNPDTGHMRYCPVFLTFCADIRRAQRIADRHGCEYASNNMDTFLNATVDAALAMQCFITAAEAEGLGCAPISQVRNRIGEFCAALDLPPGVFPIAGLTLGWPAWEGRMNARLPPSVVIHRERYDDDALEAGIDAYDARRQETNPAPPDPAGGAPRGWSESAARQLSKEERGGFRAFLQGHGFELR
tara:strand:- start:791 stop:1603 length:813 start_codon:yes stop_codon:yes gene_type:complete